MTTSPSEVRTWCMLCHLSALAMLLFSWGGLLGPLVVWLVKRQDAAAIDEHGKEALNFQITVFIVYVILGIVIAGFAGVGAFFMSPFHFWGGWGFGVLGFGALLGIVQLINFIFIIVASVTANRTGSYRYPFSLRLVK